MKWVRAQDGAIFGVCKGLARAMDLPLGLFRLFWILSLLCGGAGLLVYVLLTIALPREDRQVQALDSRVFGVCSKIAMRTGLEFGIVRLLALCLLPLSLGSVLVGYIVLYFILDSTPTQKSNSKTS